MTDLVEQLRNPYARGSWPTGWPEALMPRAADEIEALRAELVETKEELRLLADHFDQRVRAACMKTGLELGRQEEVDRKGEPLPTAREIMDKAVSDGMAHLHQRARERRVNADGSRVKCRNQKAASCGCGGVDCPGIPHLPHAYWWACGRPGCTGQIGDDSIAKTWVVGPILNAAGDGHVGDPPMVGPSLRQDGTDGSWAGD